MIRGGQIGAKFDDSTFENFEHIPGMAQALAACRQVEEGKSCGVILLGKVGTGKTHLLVALARSFATHPFPEIKAEDSIKVPDIKKLIAEGDGIPNEETPMLDPDEMLQERTVEFWPILDLVTELRSEIKMGDCRISERCCLCDLLVFDDFGEERATQFVYEELARIVDRRYRDGSPIAVSSNLSIKQIKDKYGDRYLSRWTEQCKIVKIPDKVPDYRTRKGK